VEDIQPLLSCHVLRMYMDLKPYVNPASYVVQRSCGATQAYSLFQTLGLRHLCVIEDTSAVLGVLTRKDFMASNVQAVISNRVEAETRAKRGSVSSSNGGHGHRMLLDDSETQKWMGSATLREVDASDREITPTGSVEQRRPTVRPGGIIRSKSRRLSGSDE
jgi:hypothetical protein